MITVELSNLFEIKVIIIKLFSIFEILRLLIKKLFHLQFQLQVSILILFLGRSTSDWRNMAQLD